MHYGAASLSTSNEGTPGSLALLIQQMVELIMNSKFISASDARAHNAQVELYCSV
jgi:hypothetical protein